MRVSSNMLFDSNVAAMTQQQERLMRTQQQVSTGRKILTASDDPVAAARALDVTQSDAMNTQYATNRGAARHTLSLAESTLQGVTSLLQDVKTAMVNAGNGTLNPSDRRTMATELSGRLQELAGLANSTDGIGNFLFAGFQSKTTPFVSTSAGMAYFGDDGQRNVQVSSTRQMPSSGNGADMFMRIKDGNGTFATQATSGNTGTGVISQGSIVNQTALTGHSYTIAYTGPTAAAVAGNTGNGAISTPTVVNKAALTGKDYGITFSGPATYDVTDLTVPSNTQTITTLDFSGGDGTFVVDVAGDNDTVTLNANYANEAALVAKIQADLDAGAGGAGAYTVTSTGTVAGANFAVSIVRAAGGAAVTVSAANAAAIAGGIANSPGGASVLADQPYVSGQNISFDGLQFNIQDGAAAFITGDTFTVSSPGYTVTDTTTAAVVLPTPPATGRVVHVSGQAISFDGIQIDIQGDPAAGDTFTVSPSTNESVFKPRTDLIAARNAPVVGASLTNSLNRGLNQLDNALNNVLTTRSSLGLRLNEIDALQTAGEDLGLQFKQTLSELQDVDYNQAISDLVRQQTNLQAAQQTFSKVAGLSLFDYI